MLNELDLLNRIAVALESIAKSLKKDDEIDDNIIQKIEPWDSSKKNNTDAWVLEPYCICITTMPPQYITRILHYHDPKGLCEWALQRGTNTKIFYTKNEAINYCKLSLGCEYEIVDIPAPQTVIGDDYE